MDYRIIYSKRKTVSIKILDGGEVLVRSPFGVSKAEIDRIVRDHSKWIEKHRSKVLKKADIYRDDEGLAEKTLELVTPYVEKYSHLMGVTPKSVKITSAKKRFGSCSSNGNICFSKYLGLYPADAVEYVVVHELAHLIHMNHSPAFYAVIEKYLPDMKTRKNLLKL